VGVEKLARMAKYADQEESRVGVELRRRKLEIVLRQIRRCRPGKHNPEHLKRRRETKEKEKKVLIERAKNMRM
jgi:hypothetical protein